MSFLLDVEKPWVVMLWSLYKSHCQWFIIELLLDVEKQWAVMLWSLYKSDCQVLIKEFFVRR